MSMPGSSSSSKPFQIGEAVIDIGGSLRGTGEEGAMEVDANLEVLTAAASVFDSLSAIGVALVGDHAAKLRNVRERLEGSKRGFIEREAGLKDRVKVLEAECRVKDDNLVQLEKEFDLEVRLRNEVLAENVGKNVEEWEQRYLAKEAENAELKAEMKRKEETVEQWRRKYEMAMEMRDFWLKKAKAVLPKVAEVAVQTEPALTVMMGVQLAPRSPAVPKTPREGKGGNTRDKNGGFQRQLKESPAPAVRKQPVPGPSTKKLRKDLNAHSEERSTLPHQCVFCNKSFKRLHQFENHSRVHTRERPFFCRICRESFTQSANLNQHIRTHQGDAGKIHQCPFCSMKFILKSHCKRHQQARHKSELTVDRGR